jgi:hypothetical protein
MLLGKLINVAAIVTALLLAALGAVAIAASRSGAIQLDGSVGIVAGVAFLLLAAPLFVFPFSKRVFRVLGVIDLLALAAGVLYLAFQPDLPTTRPSIYQFGAVALAVLLLARVVLGLRGRRSRQDV